MEALQAQVAQLPALLALCRSPLVRAWDAATLGRALEWAAFFQHLHGRFRARPRLRAALGRRLRQARGPALAFGHLGRCSTLLALALLENRALPPAACRHLLQRVLSPGAAAEGPGLALLARRKAASRLLPPAAPQPRVRAEAQALLARLREQQQEEEAPEGLPWLGPLLEQLPQPHALQVVATALLGGDEASGNEEGPIGGEDDGPAAAVLLAWLLQSPERLSALCRLLPGSLLAALAARHSQLSAPYLDLLIACGSRLLYDPLRGQWGSSCLEQAELSWEELRERFECLCQAPAPLGGQACATLELLKAQDGDYDVPGLSVWTDLLAEVEKSLRKEVMNPRADLKLLKGKKPA
ncbi:Fanconi anemia group F protein [Eudromia elegans]